MMLTYDSYHQFIKSNPVVKTQEWFNTFALTFSIHDPFLTDSTISSDEKWIMLHSKYIAKLHPNRSWISSNDIAR